MGRGFFHWSGIFLTAGVALLQQPAAAREPKSQGRGQTSEIKAAAVLPKNVFLAKATLTANTTVAVAGRKEEPRDSVSAARPERKPITLFRFSNQRFGNISVQPVVGGVNGAQLSIGF